MIKNLLILCGVMFATCFTAYSQRTCGTMEQLERLQEEDPTLHQRMEHIENFTNRVLQQKKSLSASEDLGVIRIPVVVHVVYNTPAQNIDDAQIISQIEVLNEDFRMLNDDSENVPEEFEDLATDVGIEFYLATEDPEGNPTTGITRTYTDVAQFNTNDNMKRSAQGGKDAWPTDQYLNLWSCNVTSFFGEILGYAQFPGGNPATDGVVINSKYFGRGGTAGAPYNLGRTGTHEVGHWLNLRHIWGDGGCNATDFVDDTPSAQREYYGCPSFPQESCGSVDMFMNYMDYVDDGCMVMFSEGQKARMRALFEPGGARESFVKDSVDLPVEYCASSAQKDLGWIEGVRINKTTNISGLNNGYGDFTGSSVDVVAGNTYLFAAQAGFADRKAPLHWRFWADFNQDGDFDDDGELLYEAVSRNIAKNNVEIPLSATEGETRVRVSAKYGSYPSPCETFQYGEVEDYAIQIQEANAERTASSTTNAPKYETRRLSLYPNPSNGAVSITADLDSEHSGVTVFLSDSRGKIIYSKNFGQREGVLTHSVSTSGLKPGLYFVTIQGAQMNEVQKLIVE